MKRICCLAALCLMAPLPILQARQFGPWDAGVAVGDGAVAPGALSEEGPRPDPAFPAIFDSFTGGALLMIRTFQIWISPQDGPSCRFRPTCSAYGRMAVQKYGAFIGSLLAGDRILRCHVFSKPGDDPVPDDLYESGR